MADMNNIVKVAVDAYHGNVECYSNNQANDLLRQALIEANGGSTVLNYKNIRDGKCNGLFALVEEILARTVIDGLQGDEYFNELVDFRNIALGDLNEFVVEDGDLFSVAEIADGTQGVRRQRLSGANVVSIPTTIKAVKIYDELSRILAGRVDFNYMIDKVSKSFAQKLTTDAYTLWNTATGDELGGNVYYHSGGDYDEDELLDIIAHVEAASGGKSATIFGTKKALRPLAPVIAGVDARNDLYNLGYFGKFYGSNVIATPQRHVAGTTDFALDDDVLTIVATGEKPIKCVYEGDPLVIMGNPLNNGDLTQEYMYADRYGMGIVLAGGNSGLGRYEYT